MGLEGMDAAAEDRGSSQLTTGFLPLPSVEVFLDGKLEKTFTVDRYDLFALWDGEYGEHEIVLKITGAGAEGYAFTFGQ
jgi:hypothetical protein